MSNDVADLRITIKVRHVYAVIATIVGLTLIVSTGWFAIKADISEANQIAVEAKKDASKLNLRVARIECLVEQQLNYQIYKIKPTSPCTAVKE